MPPGAPKVFCAYNSDERVPRRNKRGAGARVDEGHHLQRAAVVLLREGTARRIFHPLLAVGVVEDLLFFVVVEELAAGFVVVVGVDRHFYRSFFSRRGVAFSTKIL